MFPKRIPPAAKHFFRAQSTRRAVPPQFGFIPPKKGFFNWKTMAFFFGYGCVLSYSEYLFEKYADFTEIDTDPMAQVKLEFFLRKMPLYETLSHAVLGQDWVKLSSWENLDRNVLDGKLENIVVRLQPEYQVEQLTNHTLASAGGIAVKPVIFHNTKTDETVTFVHLGYKLCGYPFIVHGGMIATLLNETFKRNASLSSSTLSSLKTDYKVETLNIDYKAPAFADQFFVVRTEVVDAPGHDKNVCFLKSTLLSQQGKVLVEAQAELRNTGRGSRAAARDWKFSIPKI